ncbi:MAG: hypothetical protein ABI972_07490 [Acidobacteriota bacterium]
MLSSVAAPAPIPVNPLTVATAMLWKTSAGSARNIVAQQAQAGPNMSRVLRRALPVWIAGLSTDVRFLFLRSEPRFIAIVRKLPALRPVTVAVSLKPFVQGQ